MAENTKKRYSKIRKCCVSNCNSDSKKNADVSFHTFPASNGRRVNLKDYFGNDSQVDQLTAWKKNLKIKNTMNDKRVCSKHFTQNDYYFPDISCSQRKLRPKAVPTLNLPVNEKVMKINEERMQRIKRRERNTNKMFSVNNKMLSYKVSDVMPAVEVYNDNENLNLNHEIKSEYENEIIENSFENNFNECVCNEIQSCSNESETVSDQVKEGEKMNNTNLLLANPSKIQQQILDAEKLPEKLKSGINISSVKLPSQDFGAQVNDEYKFIKLIKNKKQLTTATGLESFEILNVIIESVKISTDNQYEKETCTMKTEDRVVMTYVKLKQNLSYSFLALIFGSVTPQHCRTIFLETIRILSKCLKLAIPWPSKEELSKNMPQCFKNFEDTRNISFISKPYGGRASDSVIFEQSGLVDLLEPSDGVMVDRGFLIEDLCKKMKFRFIQPPFLRQKKQFSQEESTLSAKIAKAKVHVERSNQRIKVFKLLGSVMPVSLVPYLEDIFTVICGTVNLSAPIIGDDKFMSDELDET